MTQNMMDVEFNFEQELLSLLLPYNIIEVLKVLENLFNFCSNWGRTR